MAKAGPAQAPVQKPNVVMLMTDGTGWNDFGACGGAKSSAIRLRTSIASPGKEPSEPRYSLLIRQPAPSSRLEMPGLRRYPPIYCAVLAHSWQDAAMPSTKDRVTLFLTFADFA
jgi:hypothetical protein